MSTTVRGVGSVVTEIYTAQGTRGTAGTGDFQKIWSSQMSKGTSENAASAADQKDFMSAKTTDKVDTSKDEKVQDTSKVQDAKPREDGGAEESEAVKADGGLTKEELEEVAEKVGSAVVELMQQIADTFGISMEELQATMQALGMENVDVLDASKLSGLLLELGGATDSYALITDEGLYEKYNVLMQQMEDTVQECADELGVDADDLLGMLKQTLEAADTENQGVNSVKPEMVVETAETADEQGTLNEGDETDGKESDNAELGRNETGVAQNISSNHSQTQIQQTESTYASSAWDIETQDIMNQIMDYMKMQVDADTTSLEMQLHPENLGTVQVHVALKGGIVTANFVTENEAVKAALESQMVQLKENFAEQGVKVEAIEVTVQPHAFERNLEQGRGREQQEPEKKNRTRRINLNDPISMDVLDDMEEGETLAAEMLAVNGGTLDYTV